MSKINLKLYIVGNSSSSQKAIENIKQICKNALADYGIELIDLILQPHLAAEDNIFATPTLIKDSPESSKRIIGDLSDGDSVLSILELLRPNNE